MIRRIELHNFMSHVHTVIEPAEGLTVLVGPNNCGKSAVVAALQILAHNENSTFVLRHGEKECAVRVETDEGTVEWRRRSSPAYIIDGQRFDRLGRGAVPPELHAVLRMPRVNTDGQLGFDIHFGEQKSPIFLIDKPPSHAAGFFASSSDAIHLVEMQALHRQRVRERRQRQISARGEAERLDRTLAGLAVVPDLQQELDRLEHEHTLLQAAEQRRRALTDQLTALEKAEREWAQRHAEVTVLSQLLAPPIRHDTGALDRHRTALARAHHQRRFHTEEAAALGPLTPLPAMQPAQMLAQHRAALHQAFRRDAQAQARQQALAELPAPPRLHDTGGLANQLGLLRDQAQEAAGWFEQAGALKSLVPPPPMAPVAAMAALIERLLGQLRLWQRESAAQAALASLPSPPVWGDSAALARLVEQQQQAAHRLAAATRAGAVLAALRPLAGALDPQPLAHWLQQAEQGRALHERAVQDAQEADRARSGLLDALQTLAQSNPPCPTCGAPIDPERWVRQLTTTLPTGPAGGHAHG